MSCKIANQFKKASDEENQETRQAFKSVFVVKAGTSNNFTENYSNFSKREAFKKNDIKTS